MEALSRAELRRELELRLLSDVLDNVHPDIQNTAAVAGLVESICTLAFDTTSDVDPEQLDRVLDAFCVLQNRPPLSPETRSETKRRMDLELNRRRSQIRATYACTRQPTRAPVPRRTSRRARGRRSTRVSSCARRGPPPDEPPPPDPLAAGPKSSDRGLNAHETSARD